MFRSLIARRARVTNTRDIVQALISETQVGHVREGELAMPGAQKVLVIDDDADFQASIKAVLEGHGYLVIEAYSGKEGLRKLVEHNPDAVVLDIIMESDSEGYTVNAAIKHQEEYARYRDVPVIMVSSIQSSPDELYPRAIEVNMIRPDRYLTKPLDIHRFLQVMRKVTERHARSTH